MSIDGKRDPHKSDRETESLIEFGPQIRIDHLDLSSSERSISIQ